MHYFPTYYYNSVSSFRQALKRNYEDLVFCWFTQIMTQIDTAICVLIINVG